MEPCKSLSTVAAVELYVVVPSGQGSSVIDYHYWSLAVQLCRELERAERSNYPLISKLSPRAGTRHNQDQHAVGKSTITTKGGG